jgi:glutaredoxin
MSNHFINAILLIFSSFILSAQSKDVELIEERGKSNIQLFAQNNTNDELDITVKADIIGFTTTDKSPINKLLPPKGKVLVLSLTAPPGVSCQYQTSLSYKKVNKAVANSLPSNKNRSTGIQINTTKLNVFTQDGCARCEYVIKQLDSLKIPYVELNTSIHAPNKNLMFEKLYESGLKENTVQMPVVLSKGKLEYNIKDLQKWVKTLK